MSRHTPKGGPGRRGRDSELLKMVETYLISNSNKTYVDIEDMVSNLQAQSYRFSRLKKAVFVGMVKDAYYTYCTDSELRSSGKDPNTAPVRREPLDDINLIASDISDSDIEIEEPPPPKTLVASQLTGLYRSSKPAANAPTQSPKKMLRKKGILLNPSNEISSTSISRSPLVLGEAISPPRVGEVLENEDPEDDLEIIEEVNGSSGSSTSMETETNVILSSGSNTTPETPETSTLTLKPKIKSANQHIQQGSLNAGASAPSSGLTTPSTSGKTSFTSLSEIVINSPRVESGQRGLKRKNVAFDDEKPQEVKRDIKKNKKDVVLPQESTITFDDFGGSEDQIEEIHELIMHMKVPEYFEHLGVPPPRGFLLYGVPGCGKTLLANAIAGELKVPILKTCAAELISGISGESESNIRQLFEQALNLAPCIVFLDEIDSITPKRETSQREMEKRIVTQLGACIDELATKEKGNLVLLIGATNRLESIDNSLRREGRFDREICLGIPDQTAREKIIGVLTRKLHLNPDINISTLARLTPGYVGADLQGLFRAAGIVCVKNAVKAHVTEGTSDSPTRWLRNIVAPEKDKLDEVVIQMKDFEFALKRVQPSSLREGFTTVPDTTWDDIGALKEIRDELQVSILGPIKHASAFKSLGLTAPAGVLLCGPPGCGKTLLAKAVANEAGINFISVKGPELLSMYVGESEKAVRECFLRARNSAPCVIFFDEIDSLCARRSEGPKSGSSSLVVNTVLTEMDGLGSRKGVFIMAATNRPDILDPAILRPGRLDQVIFVNLPSPTDRADILKAITTGKAPSLGEDVDLEAIGLSEKCTGYTGADLAGLVRQASKASFKEFVDEPLKKNEATVCKDEDLRVYHRHFEAAFKATKPSVSKTEQEKYEKMQERYSSQNTAAN